MKRTIEVELRGLLTKKQHDSLIARLTSEGIASEADDKDTYFFDFPRGILKVCDEQSKHRAKISLKLGAEEHGALEETEISIAPQDIPAALTLFAALGYTSYHLVPQQRTNYFLPDGVTLSLKYTQDFQYHFELEGRLLDDPSNIEPEKRRLQKVCTHYRIGPLEPHEIAARVKLIKKRLGFSQT